MKLIITLALTCLLSACNMVAGAGRDITNSSDWVKNKISGSNTSKDASQKTTPPSQSAPASTSTPSAPVAPAAQTSI